MADLLGRTLGPYQVLLKIRTSPLTAIYKAFDVARGRSVTLEAILPNHPHPAMLFYRLRDHAAALQELIHPNIGELLDCEMYDDVLCMVYDFVPKGYLRRRFNQRMSYREAAQRLIPVAQALTYAHQKGVVHGSLRPANIILNEEGTPTLFDFGVEQIIAKELMMQSPGNWIGSGVSSYTAPEVVLGRDSTPAADVYSLGAVFYELITGRRPYVADTSLSEIIAACYEDLPKARAAVKELPETVQLVLEKSLAREPEKRFADMQHFTNLLGKIALGQPLTAEMVTYANWQPRPRRLGWMWGLAALALVGAAVGGFFWQQRQREQAVLTLQSTGTAPAAVEAAPSAAEQPPPPTAALAQAPSPTAAPRLTPSPKPTATRAPVIQTLNLPVFVGADLPAHTVIKVDNAVRMLNLARWGVGSLKAAAWSPDGEQYAVATTLGVFILDGEDFAVQLILDTSGAVESVAFSADGKRLATGETSGLVRVWENGSGKEIAALGGHQKAVNRVAFSPDGTRLVSGSDDFSVRVWDVDAGRLAWSAVKHAKEVTAVDFAPDGQTVISGGIDFKLKIWDAASGEERASITAPAAVYDTRYSPDGRRIYAALGNHTVRSWDAQTGQPVETFSGVTAPITSIAVAANNRRVAAGDLGGRVYYWDLETQAEQNRPRSPTSTWVNERLVRSIAPGFVYVNQVAFTPDSERLSSGIWDGTIVIWNLESRAEERRFFGLSEYNRDLVFSPDSRLLAVESLDGSVKLWDVAHNRPLYAALPGGLVTGKIFSSDSRYLAIKEDAATVKVVETQTGAEIFRFGGHRNIESISFSPDGKMLAAGIFADLHLWSLVSGQEIITVKNFGFDGCTVGSGQFGTALYFGTRFGWSDFVQGGQTALCRQVKGGWMDHLVFQPGGYLAAAGGVSRIAVWTVGRASEEVDLQGTMNYVTDQLVVAPSGTWVAAAMDDLSIRIWDTSSGAELMRLTGHSERITGLAVSPDGQLLASASLDGTVRIWGVK